MSEIALPAADEPAIDAEALKKAEQFIEAEEGASNKLRGALGIFVSATAVVMSLFHLYTAYAIVPAQVLRPVHVGFVLFLSYLLFPASKRYRHRIMWWDWVAAFAVVAVIAYILRGGDDIWDRNTSPDNWDIVFGVALILLILEGMRRASGWVMPLVVASFVVYALFGEQLPGSWAHRSYEVGRLVGHLYMTLEGIFGVAVDVSSSLCSRSMGRSCSFPVRASSSSISRSPPWAESPPAPAAPWCLLRSSSAVRQGAASRPR